MAGWVIETKLGNIYFAGDTGYSSDFQKIGKKFSPIKVSMIPIGAYKPRWFMKTVHIDPPNAVKITENHMDWPLNFFDPSCRDQYFNRSDFQ